MLQELSANLSEEGYDITLLTTGESADAKRDTHGIEVVRVKGVQNPRSVFANLLISLRLFLRALFLPRPAVIITKTDPPFFVILGAWLALLKRADHIHWSQDLYPDILKALHYKLPAPLYRALDFLTSRALKSCSRVVAIGVCMKSALQKKGVISSQITVIPNWPSQLTTKKEQKATQPEDMPQKFRVLYAGNMNAGHPYQTILEAAELLNENDPDIEFLFVGDSPLMQDMAQERARRGLDNIRFLPFQPADKLKALLESGDLHIVSLADEALGCMVPSRIYDIFAVKRPCLFIGPEDSEIAIMLEKHEAGLTIPQGRSEMLANAIRHLRDNGEDWNALYQGAIQASKIYTPQRCFELWQNLLKKV